MNSSLRKQGSDSEDKCLAYELLTVTVSWTYLDDDTGKKNHCQSFKACGRCNLLSSAFRLPSASGVRERGQVAHRPHPFPVRPRILFRRGFSFQLTTMRRGAENVSSGDVHVKNGRPQTHTISFHAVICLCLWLICCRGPIFWTYPNDNLLVAFLLITSKRVSIISSISCSSSLFQNEVCTG